MTVHLAQQQLEDFPEDIEATYDPAATVFQASVDETEEFEAGGRATVATPPPDSQTADWRDEITPSGRVARYKSKRVIGTGGCGEVWEAVQTTLSRTVALKRVRKDILSRPNAQANRHLLERLLRNEAITTSNLEHPAIVPIYDLGEDSTGVPQFAMKKLRGQNWEKILEEDAGSLGREQYLLKHLGILMQVVQAVAFAHSRGVVHRDIKPSQVMVGDFGEVTVMDWGLAVVFNQSVFSREAGAAAAGAAPQLDGASSPAGTLAYMAPEQMKDTAADVGPHTDIYLLGGCLYYLLSLRSPHYQMSKRRCMEMARTGKINPLECRAFQGDPPSALTDLIRRSLDPSPEFRPASAQELLHEIQHFLSGQGRRHEAEIVMDSIEAQLSKGDGLDYHAYAGAIAGLQRAAVLFPGSPRMAKLSARLYEAFAQYALAHDDLSLAEVQAEFIPDESSRQAILQSVEEGRRRQSLQERTRRQALLLCGVLVFVLIVASGVFAAFTVKLLIQADRDREAAVAQSIEADLARGRTEQLLDFMIVELGQDLVTGRPAPETVNRLASEVVDYYAYNVDRPADPRETLVYAERLSRAGELHASLQEFEDAERAFRSALSLSGIAQAESEDKEVVENAVRLQAATLARLASVLESLGRAGEAEETRNEAEALRRR